MSKSMNKITKPGDHLLAELFTFSTVTEDEGEILHISVRQTRQLELATYVFFATCVTDAKIILDNFPSSSLSWVRLTFDKVEGRKGTEWSRDTQKEQIWRPGRIKSWSQSWQRRRGAHLRPRNDNVCQMYKLTTEGVCYRNFIGPTSKDIYWK